VYEIALTRAYANVYIHTIYTYVHDNMCGNCVGAVYSVKNNHEYVNWLDLDLLLRGKQ
jgi:hypothetical protein